MNIIPATTADIPALCELLTVLFKQEAEFKPDPVAQARGLAHIIADPGIGLILVAHSQGRPVGMVNLLYTVSTALGERVALLEDMVVASSLRSSGIGSALITEAMAAARLAGCKRITLLTDRTNQAAQAFYLKHGFRASEMLPLRLILDDD